MDPTRIQAANAAFEALKERNFADATLDELRAASKGVYYDEELMKKSAAALMSVLRDAAKEGHALGIHPDSITAHQNYGAAKFGLRISDIQALKPGDTLELIVFCRNTGDSADGTKPGTRWGSLLEGMKATTCYSPATYTHREGMRGRLDLTNGCVHEDFEWQVNAMRTPLRIYWAALDSRCSCEKDGNTDVEGEKDGDDDDKPAAANQNVLTWDMFDPKTRVGWRGPVVRVSDLPKFPVQHVTHYDNFWNDYGVIENFDLTDCE